MLQRQDNKHECNEHPRHKNASEPHISNLYLSNEKSKKK